MNFLTSRPHLLYILVSILILLSLLALNRTSHADSLEHHILAQLSSARSIAEIESIRSYFDRLRIARTACQIQLKSEMVPSTCYRALQLEREIGLHKDPHEKLRLETRLDNFCIRAANKLHIESAAIQDVSPTCRRKVIEAQRIQAYRENSGANFEIN